MASDRLIVGLGNPGPEYDWTRHNMGFHVLDRVASERGVLFQSASRWQAALQARGSTRPYTGPKGFTWALLPGEELGGAPDVWLVKPMTYMNRSGQVVGPIARTLLAVPPPADPAQEPPSEPVLPFDPTRLLVVYDDLDLPLGGLRIRPHGGHGGQNGMRSIIEHLGTNRFPRLRVGIGSPGTDAVRHVLETFPASQRVEAEISVAEAAEALLDWCEHGDLEGCMSRFHSRWNRES